MKKTTKKFNQNIINSLLIIGLLVLIGGGCQQINDLANSGGGNGNKTANTNTAANSPVTANSNANANSKDTTSNSSSNTTPTTSPTAEATPKPANLAEDIVGKWEMTANGKTIGFDFSADKKVKSYIDGKEASSGTYRILDEKTIETVGDDGGTDKVPIKIEGNKMTMTYNGTDLNLTKK